jgi:hypothetical protein
LEKEMKANSKISGYIIRSAAYAVFLSVAFIAASWAFNSPNTWHKSLMATGVYESTAKSPSQPRAFSFAQRVAYQRAIEDVYWRHQIWPKENPDPKPSLDAVMTQAQLKKVAGYLRDSLDQKHADIGLHVGLVALDRDTNRSSSSSRTAEKSG